MYDYIHTCGCLVPNKCMVIFVLFDKSTVTHHPTYREHTWWGRVDGIGGGGGGAGSSTHPPTHLTRFETGQQSNVEQEISGRSHDQLTTAVKVV